MPLLVQFQGAEGVGQVVYAVVRLVMIVAARYVFADCAFLEAMLGSELVVFVGVFGRCCQVFGIRVVVFAAAELMRAGKTVCPEWLRIGLLGDILAYLCTATTGLCVEFGCDVGGDGPCFGHCGRWWLG